MSEESLARTDGPVSDGAVSPDATAGLAFAEWLARVINDWRLLARTVAVIVVLAIVAMLVIPPTYRGRASFLAVTLSHGSIPAQFAGVAAQLGISPNVDPGTTPPFYAELVVSRGFLTDLAMSRYADPRRRAGATPAPDDSVTLVQLLEPGVHDPRKALDKTLRKLDKDVDVTPDTRTNLVAIAVTLRWPTLARNVANRILTLVNTFNVTKRESRAHLERAFVQSRLAEAETDSRRTEDSLRDFYERNRIWQQSPANTIEEARLRRRVTIANEVYMTLRREFETARVEEVNDQPVITVVDTAIAPVRRQWPQPIPVLAAAIVIGVLIGAAVVGTGVLFYDWAARNPAAAADLRTALARVRPRRTHRAPRPPGAVPL